METTRLLARIEQLLETEAEWLITDPILLKGEIAVVKFGNTTKIKIGDGIKKFSQTPYMVFETGETKGGITPSSPAVTPTAPVSFIAETGIYPNFGDVEITGAAGYIVWNGTAWKAINVNIDLAGYATTDDFKPVKTLAEASVLTSTSDLDILEIAGATGGFVNVSNMPYSKGEALRLPNGAVGATSTVFAFKDYLIDQNNVGKKFIAVLVVEHPSWYNPDTLDSLLGFTSNVDGSTAYEAVTNEILSSTRVKLTSERVILSTDASAAMFWRLNTAETAPSDGLFKTVSAGISIEDVTSPAYQVAKNALSSILINPAYNVDVANGATAASGIISVPIGQSGSGSTFGFDLIKALPDWKNNFSGRKIALSYVVKAKNITSETLLFRGLYNTFVGGNTEIWSNFSTIKFKTEGGFDYFLVSGYLQLPVYSADITVILAYFVFSNANTATLKTIEVSETVVKPFAETFAEIQDDRKKFISQFTLSQSYKLNQRIDVPVLFIQEVGEINGTVGRYVGITEMSKRQAFIPAGQNGNTSFIYTNLDKLANCNFLYENLKGKKITIEVLVKAQGIAINQLTALCHQNINGVLLQMATNQVSEILVDALQSIYSLKFDITLTDKTLSLNPFVTQNGSNTALNRTFEIIGMGVILAYDYDNVKLGMSKAEYKNYVESSIIKQETETQRSIKNIVKVKKNGTIGVDCAFNGNRGIQDAIDAIQDASLNNPYTIVAEGHFIATTAAELDAPSHDNLSFVSSKDFVSLHGVSPQKTIIEVSMPNNLSAGTYSTYQTILWESDFAELQDIAVIIENGRYAIHIDKSSFGLADLTERFNNVVAIHRGNTGNATAWPTPVPFGVGTSSGLKLLFENCKLQALQPNMGTLHGHTNAVFERPSLMSYKNCRFLSNGKVLGKIRPLGINVEDLFYLEGCSFEGGYTVGLLITDLFPTFTPTLATIPYNVSNSVIKGFGNYPILYKNEITTGYALRIKSKSTGSSSAVRFDETKNGFIAIIKDRDYDGRDYVADNYEHNVDGYAYKDGDTGFSGYAIGRLDVGEEDARIPAKKLGQRLGDCSSVNKTLTVIIDGVTYNVVFNVNCTAMSNTAVLAIINAVIGSVADVDLYSVANDYFVEFTDVLELCSADEAILNGDAVVKEAGKLRKAKDNDFKVYGIAIDNIRANESGRVVRNGYMSTVNTDRFKINMETYAAVTKGQKFGVSTTYGKIQTGASYTTFVAIDDNVLSFNL